MSPVVGWPDGQLRALASAFDTFVADAYEGESPSQAELAASARNEVAEPADLRQLRPVLSLPAAPIGVSSLTGARSFSRLGCHEGRTHDGSPFAALAPAVLADV